MIASARLGRGAVAFLVIGATFGAHPAAAVSFETIEIFGDSFSDTGAGFILTNGETAASYLAELVGSEVALPTDANIGNKSINFAESGARVGVERPGGPTSLSNQVQNFADLVTSGEATFNPDTTLFFLSGGLNDHELAPASDVTDAYRSQVSQLVSLGAKYIEIALLPAGVPPFTDSANLLNPAYGDLVPELDAQYPGTSITLSYWGEFYDDILANPSAYGITKTTDPCVLFGSDEPPCSNPDEYFYYYIVHPSDAAHRIVGQRLYEEALSIPAIGATAIPVPATLPLLFLGVLALGACGVRSGRFAGHRLA